MHIYQHGSGTTAVFLLSLPFRITNHGRLDKVGVLMLMLISGENDRYLAEMAVWRCIWTLTFRTMTAWGIGPKFAATVAPLLGETIASLERSWIVSMISLDDGVEVLTPGIGIGREIAANITIHNGDVDFPQKNTPCGFDGFPCLSPLHPFVFSAVSVGLL